MKAALLGCVLLLSGCACGQLIDSRYVDELSMQERTRLEFCELCDRLTSLRLPGGGGGSPAWGIVAVGSQLSRRR